jgi:mono/diheme cytochrome c family protein
MKSIFRLTVLLLMVFTLAGFAWKTGSPSGKIPADKKDSNPIPAAIFKVMENSCLACHGTDGKAMALSHVKMQDWDGYSSEKQAQKAAAICKMVTKGKMPPKGYLKNHPDAALTQDQIQKICAWSESLNKGK